MEVQRIRAPLIELVKHLDRLRWGEDEVGEIQRNQISLRRCELLLAATTRAEAGSCTVRTRPVRVRPNFFQTGVIEVFEAQAAVVLLACSLQLLLVGSAALLVLHELLKHETVHYFDLMALRAVDFDAINLS